MPRRSDILDAVFERSFNKLSESGRWIFLIATNWRSAISEAAFLVVLSQRDLDVEQGLEECQRLSLINLVEFTDGAYAYSTPQVARIYGRKKLQGDPDQFLIQEDIDIIRKFGVLPTTEPIQIPQENHLINFANWCIQNCESDPSSFDKLDRSLELLSAIWPTGWIHLSSLRKHAGRSPDEINYALRRAVEEIPHDKRAWLERADYASEIGDESTYITSRIRAVEIDPSDVSLIREVAIDLCKYIQDHLSDIPVAKRSIYLASVRDHMVRHADVLDATGLSRLAWLFLLENNKEKAWHFASEGLVKDSKNSHCFNIINRLRDEGFHVID